MVYEGVWGFMCNFYNLVTFCLLRRPQQLVCFVLEPTTCCIVRRLFTAFGGDSVPHSCACRRVYRRFEAKCAVSCSCCRISDFGTHKSLVETYAGKRAHNMSMVSIHISGKV